MTIELAVIGKTTQAFTREGMRMYAKRIGRYVNFSIHELKPPKFSNKTPIKIIKEKEGQIIQNHIDKLPAFTILLDEKGKRFTSKAFASFIQKQAIDGRQRLVFVVGGAYGFSPELINNADMLLSFSDMTFSHQIIRLFFTEQLYRAYTIINKEPYHNE